MSTQDLIVQRPATSSQLVLLFHGVGSSALDLAPLGHGIDARVVDAIVRRLHAPSPASI